MKQCNVCPAKQMQIGRIFRYIFREYSQLFSLFCIFMFELANIHCVMFIWLFRMHNIKYYYVCGKNVYGKKKTVVALHGGILMHILW